MLRDRLSARPLAAPVVIGLAGLLAFAAGGDAGFLGEPTKKTTLTYEFNGRKIAVWEYEPVKPAKNLPALVLLYGLDCLADDPNHYEFIAQRFAGKGYLVQLVHYFNCTHVKKDDVLTLQQRIKDSLCPKGPEVDDLVVRKHFEDWMAAVRAGVDRLRKRDNVDADRVSLVGFSLGGFLAMSLVATEPALPVAAVVQCFGGLPRELHRTFKSAPPILIFHGEKDDVVPVKEARDLSALLRAKRVVCEEVIYADVGHMFLNGDGKLNFTRVFEAEKTCLQFLDRHVKNGKAPR